jgi:hypothetical protein
MPLQRPELLAGGHIPEVHALVVARGRQQPALVGPVEAAHAGRMRQRSDQGACLQIVEVNRPVGHAGDGQMPPIGVEADAIRGQSKRELLAVTARGKLVHVSWE